MNNFQVPTSTLTKVEECISKFGLLRPKERICVAFSGGKDSTLLALALAQLGFEVHLIAIDMGYSQGWGQKILDSGRRMGFENTHVISCNNPSAQSIPINVKERIRKHLDILSSLTSQPSAITPCTHCYNVKAANLLLKCLEVEGKAIAFGHHATDAMSSFLKSVIMHMDRWERGHEVFLRENFSNLVNEVLTEIVEDDGSSLIEYSNKLVNLSKAGTDEPPRQPLTIEGVGSIPIVRPLFLLLEGDIEKSTQNLGVTFEGSGCGHGATINTQTPREMIQWRILRKLEKSTSGHTLLLSLFDLMLETVDVEGSSKFNFRNNRDKILGSAYKGDGDLSKKF